VKELDTYQLSPRVQITRGSTVRFSGGGPEHNGNRMTLPGKFQVRKVLGRGQRVYLEVYGLDQTGGTYTVFISGRAYKNAGLTWRPYKIRRCK